MGVLDRFEKAVSHGVNEAFDIGGSNIQPVDILAQIRYQMDQSQTVLEGQVVAVPNEFVVLLHPQDLQRLEEFHTDRLASELAKHVTLYAHEQEYAFLGPVKVSFLSAMDQPEGAISVDALIKRGPAAPVISTPATPAHPIIDIEGQHWLLTEPIMVIGRGSEADIVINDPGISRRHLELRITPGGIVATDLGSTNGTYVEGRRITAATLVNGNELTLGRTHILFWAAEADQDYSDYQGY